MDKDDLLALIFVLVPLSLLSLGGGGAITAGLEAEVVRLRQWLTPQEFIPRKEMIETSGERVSITMCSNKSEIRLDGWLPAPSR